MVHQFSDEYQKWYNTYEIIEMAHIYAYRVHDGSLIQWKVINGYIPVPDAEQYNYATVDSLMPSTHLRDLEAPQFISLDDTEAYKSFTGFIFRYQGISVNYYGHIISDGNRFAYLKYENGEYKYTREILEDGHLNLYVRSIIRSRIREYLDIKEFWPVADQGNFFTEDGFLH